MIKIIFLGDIVGKIGRQTVTKNLPALKKKFKPDLVIANAENIAHGSGVTAATLTEMKEVGIDWFTTGDHAFTKTKTLDDIYGGDWPILRPANYSQGVPGRGETLIEIGKHKILLINLIGRVFMKMDYDCPFRKLDEIMAAHSKKNLSAIIVELHAEATSEKYALKHYVDGRISALLGSHTHVLTADQQITGKGTAFISDIGMTGFAGGVIGIDKENIIKTFLTQIKSPNVLPEKGEIILNGVLLTINSKNEKTTDIKPINIPDIIS